jgi:hypothetical protein
MHMIDVHVRLSSEDESEIGSKHVVVKNKHY